MQPSPRQRLRRFGSAQLQDSELLAVLLQGHSGPVQQARWQAEALLQALPEGLGSLRQLAESSNGPKKRAQQEALTAPAQVTPQQLTTLAAALELGLRAIHAEALALRPRLDEPERVARYVASQEPAEGEAGLLAIDEEGRLVLARTVPSRGNWRTPLLAAYLEHPGGQVLLWRWRRAEPEIRSEDRYLATLFREGCQWLGLQLQALIVGPGASWRALQGQNPSTPCVHSDALLSPSQRPDHPP